MTGVPVRRPPTQLPLQGLLWVFLVTLLVQPLVEPDFGWHLRAGLDLLQNGWHLPVKDPYSHTMSEWLWVDHAWLTNGILALIYQALGAAGPLGIILVFAGVTGWAFWLAAGRASASRTSRLVALSLVLWIALPFLGARTQMISLLGLAIVVILWERYRRGSLMPLWVFPGMFLLWANLHGGFTVGLFTLGLLLVGSCGGRLLAAGRGSVFFRDEPLLSWPRIGYLAVIVCLAALVTLLNPYGWRLHQEIYESLTDRFMIDTLHEWQPASLENRAGRWYFVYLALLAVGMGLYYRRREPLRWLLLAVFLIFSLRHLRNIPLFLLLSVGLCAEVLEEAAAKMTPAVKRGWQLRRGWRFAVIVTIALGLIALGPDHWKSVLRSGLEPAEYFRSTGYPIEAIEWIRVHREQSGTKLFNGYGIGGFLLWWLPDTKIFIDGRMPAWRMGDRWIFYDYVALTAWEPPELGVLAKYGVDWALVETGSSLAAGLDATGQWDATYRDHKVILYLKRRHAEAEAESIGRAS